MPAGSISPRLHQATGLRRFSLFPQRFFCPRPLLLSVQRSRASCLMGQPRWTPRCHLRTQGHMHSKADSSGGLLATSFGGLHRFHGQHILYGRPSSQFCVIFLSVFVIFILDVLAHILIFGSVQFLYASSIYTLFLYACTPTLFPPAFPSCVYSLFSFSVQP